MSSTFSALKHAHIIYGLGVLEKYLPEVSKIDRGCKLRIGCETEDNDCSVQTNRKR